MATNTSSSDAREKAGGTDEPTHPKRGLRGSLASASERVRRALAGNRAKTEETATVAAVTGTHPVTPAPQGEADDARASVRALARSLLHQDRTGEPLEPSAADALAADALTADADAEREEPKTTPRAKSVPPPLPPRVSDDTQDNVSDSDLAASATSSEADVQPAVTAPAPVVSARTAQLRARLAAAKAQLAETQARLSEQVAAAGFAESSDTAEAQTGADLEDAAQAPDAAEEALEEIDSEGALPLDGEIAQVDEVSATADAAPSGESVQDLPESAASADDLDEFEDLEAGALVDEEPAPSRELAP